MLVLSRKVREEIIIGNTIRVTVLNVAGERVKLGFTAPCEVPICRKEIAQTQCETVTLPAAHVPQCPCWQTTQKE